MSEGRSPWWRDVIVNAVTWAVLALAVVGSRVLLRSAGLENEELWADLVVALAVVIALLVLVRKWLVRRFVRGLALLTARWWLRADIGLANVYKDLGEAGPRILAELQVSESVRSLVQLGRGMWGGHQGALLFDGAVAKGTKLQLRLLYADVEGPYLSEERARERKSFRVAWVASIQFVEGSVKTMREAGVRVLTKKHREPYLWQLFIFDKRVLFVAPYLYQRNNDARAPVFEFRAAEGGEGSLFNVFSDYFEGVWNRSPDGA